MRWPEGPRGVGQPVACQAREESWSAGRASAWSPTYCKHTWRRRCMRPRSNWHSEPDPEHWAPSRGERKGDLSKGRNSRTRALFAYTCPAAARTVNRSRSIGRDGEHGRLGLLAGLRQGHEDQEEREDTFGFEIAVVDP